MEPLDRALRLGMFQAVIEWLRASSAWMRAYAIVPLVAAIAVTITPHVAFGQTASPPSQMVPRPIDNDSDPTRPVFLSVRPEFYSVSDDVEQRALILRFDARVLQGLRPFNGAPGVLLRFEVPFMAADVRQDDASGLGDTYGQFLVMPYATPKFVWAIGTGFILPTASDELIGGGKWVLAPVGAPVWRFSQGLFFIKVQNFISIAGDRSRPDVNHLLITPTFIRAVSAAWWVLADSETKTRWADDGRTGVKSGFQVGRRLGQGVGLWVKPEVWWGPNRDGRWNLKFGLVWYQRRPAGSS